MNIAAVVKYKALSLCKRKQSRHVLCLTVQVLRWKTKIKSVASPEFMLECQHAKEVGICLNFTWLILPLHNIWDRWVDKNQHSFCVYVIEALTVA